MRVVPARTRWIQISTILVSFGVGPMVAYALSPLLSPGSDLVAAVAPLSFGLVLFFGVILWAGFGVVSVLLGGLARMARGRRPPGRPGMAETQPVPPGYVVFVVLGVLAGVMLGIAGAVLSDASFLLAMTGWLGLGTGYGVGLWLAAHHGYFPFPEAD